MPPVTKTNSNAQQTGSQDSPASAPDLVRQVAERVYRMLIHDLKIENERRGRPPTPFLIRRGD